MDELEALQLAEMIEDSGYRFYTEAAKKIKDGQIRDLLERLAEDELRHKTVFQSLYQQLLLEKDDYDDSYLFGEQVEKYFRQLASTAVFPDPAAVPELLKKLTTTEQVLTWAIKAEETSISYYEQLQAESRGGKIREATRRLIAEEMRHKDDLESMLQQNRD